MSPAVSSPLPVSLTESDDSDDEGFPHKEVYGDSFLNVILIWTQSSRGGLFV